MMTRTRSRIPQDGFTFVEMAFVVVIIGLIVNIAFPYIRNVRTGADASSVMSDLNTIRLAGFDHMVATGTFPATGALGVVPPEMADRLPPDFDFVYQDARYMWIAVNHEGQAWVGPMIVGQPDLIERVAQLSATEKVQGPSFCWFIYTN
ncbi:MAG: prepilin-type N-terminal cleavage/methylation domain-containing protein [Candidatus Eisenbacteria bacterium]